MTDRSSERLGIGAQSPDGKLVAAWSAGELGIWEVDGGQTGSAPLPSMIAVPGPIAWSPDSASLAYLVSTDYCPLEETSLLKLDLADMGAEVLLGFNQPAFAGLIWETADRMTLIDETGNLWEYDFVNPPVPATPTGDLRPLDRLE